MLIANILSFLTLGYIYNFSNLWLNYSFDKLMVIKQMFKYNSFKIVNLILTSWFTNRNAKYK